MREQVKNFNFGKVEAILYAYPGMENSIKTLQAYIRLVDDEKLPSCTANYNVDCGGRQMGSDPDKLNQIEAFVARRIKIKGRLEAKLELVQAQKAAVEAAMGALGEDSELARLVRTVYFDNFKLKSPGRKVWRTLSMGREKYEDMRCRVVKFFAGWLGEVVYGDDMGEMGEEIT